MAYFRATRFFYEAASKMEEKFFDEGCRPMGSYNERHDEMYGSIVGQVFTLQSPFTLVASVFVLALITSIVMLLAGLN
jgi:hypothetical protein